MVSIPQICKQAKEASYYAAILSSDQKNGVLIHMAQALRAQQERIIAENNQDVKAAKEKNLAPAMIDRLVLNAARIEDMAHALEEVAALPDPVSEVVKEWERPNGLQIQKVRIPLGVIGMIYESRPNVTVDAAGLCLKSGNCVVLRGGSEAIHSNLVLAEILREVLKEEGLHQDMIQVIPSTDREMMKEMLLQDETIDLIIPRGGHSLMKFIREYSKIPVIKHDKGVCHLFVDESADVQMAVDICLNSKVQRPGVCNALETLLVHEKIAPRFLPILLQKFEEAKVEVRACAKTLELYPHLKAATNEDWDAEYLDLIIALKLVKNFDEALQHIRRHSSLHTESIVTSNTQNTEKFLKSLNSSVVLVNASTRFNDGGQLGLGAEIGISTTKLHAFGPMGLEELTSQKYIVRGVGQIRK